VNASWFDATSGIAAASGSADACCAGVCGRSTTVKEEICCRLPLSSAKHRRVAILSDSWPTSSMP
jgi:hypothetical protein